VPVWRVPGRAVRRDPVPGGRPSERLAEVEAARRSLESASARPVAELDGRRVTDERYGTRTKDYLCVQFRHDPRAAARLLRTGRALRRLDVVDAALLSGRITLEHAALLAALANRRVAHVVQGALVVDSLGVPLDLGRSVRFAARDQRRALAARDGGCVFPGCGAPASWTDAHHVVRFSDGGSTDLSNLASLCRHHHGVVHRRGWSMAATEGQRFTFTTPRGLVLDSQRHGRRGQDTS
jgi:hypothetical protein